MPDPSSVITRLRPARHRPVPRRESRRFVTRVEVRLIVLSSVPAVQSTRTQRCRTWVWTLYARWEWTLGTARIERARRRSRPAWG